MTDIGGELAVQSFCFRDFKDNRTVAGLVRECGLDGIELCGIHADFTNPTSFQEVLEVYRDAGIRIVSIGVQTITGDEAAARPFFECVKMAGARYMSVTFPVSETPTAYRVAEKLAEEYDVLLGIHNHGGRHWLGSMEMLNSVFQNTSERIGLCLDTAWAIDSGEDPIAMAERFSDRLYGLHLKDFLYDERRRHRDVVVGSGILDLPAFFHAVRARDFGGYAALEYEADPENPLPAHTACTKAVRKDWRETA